MTWVAVFKRILLVSFMIFLDESTLELRMDVSPISLFPLNLDLIRKERKIGSGTGFIYSKGNDFYLVTNYHVVTCRDPKRPEFLLPGYPDSPDRIEFILHSKGGFTGAGIRIDLNQEVPFREHPLRSEGVDIVALKIVFSERHKDFITSQKDLKLVNDIPLEVTSSLFIVGFPWGESASLRFPVWKKGTIASEPNYYFTLPRFYIDAFTHPGMSGSPVFSSENRAMLMVNERTHDLLTQVDKGEKSALEAILHIDSNDLKESRQIKMFSLVGVYSGRLTIGQKDPNLGIVWPIRLLEEIFEKGVLATNPYPPIMDN